MIKRRNRGSVPANATLLSARQVCSRPVESSAAVQGLEAIFRELSPLIMSEGILLGHLKGTIQWDDAVCSLSMTRAESVDITMNSQWKQIRELPHCTVTVNLLSIAECAVTQAQLEKLLADFAKE